MLKEMIIFAHSLHLPDFKKCALNLILYAFLFYTGSLDLGNCSILWPPTNDSLPGLQKCVKEVGNYTENCHLNDTGYPAFSFHIECLLAKECMCSYNNPAVNAIFEFGAYLYPSSIEFSILVG